jgi:hypothetical protein
VAAPTTASVSAEADESQAGAGLTVGLVFATSTVGEILRLRTVEQLQARGVGNIVAAEVQDVLSLPSGAQNLVAQASSVSAVVVLGVITEEVGPPWH